MISEPVNALQTLSVRIAAFPQMLRTGGNIAKSAQDLSISEILRLKPLQNRH